MLYDNLSVAAPRCASWSNNPQERLNKEIRRRTTEIASS